MPSIFLSHAEEDKGFAEKLRGDLEAKGAQVWLYEIHVLPGDELVRKIADSISGNDYLGVIVSPAAKKSEWVTLEVGMALAIEHALGYSKVIPILYGDCEIPAFLKHKVYVDLHTDYDGGVVKILEVLKKPAKKFEPEFGPAVSVESFEELQHELNTIAEGFRLFKEDRQLRLRQQLREIDEDYSRRGIYNSGLRLVARTGAEQDAEWEIEAERVKAACEIERVRLRVKRLYPGKEIVIPWIFR